MNNKSTYWSSQKFQELSTIRRKTLLNLWIQSSWASKKEPNFETRTKRRSKQRKMSKFLKDFSITSMKETFEINRSANFKNLKYEKTWKIDSNCQTQLTLQNLHSWQAMMLTSFLGMSRILLKNLKWKLSMSISN